MRRGEDIDECKAAFRTLALALHPDVSGGSASDAERFAAVVQAYEDITQGLADDERPRGAGLRCVKSVGGMLIVSIESLRRDPDCEVYTIRLALDAERDEPGMAAAGAGVGDGGGALDTEAVHLLEASVWDSVADVRAMLQAQLGLEPATRGGRRRGAGDELIARGQLLGEHLFLHDYGVVHGDTLHYAVSLAPRR